MRRVYLLQRRKPRPLCPPLPFPSLLCGLIVLYCAVLPGRQVELLPYRRKQRRGSGLRKTGDLFVADAAVAVIAGSILGGGGGVGVGVFLLLVLIRIFILLFILFIGTTGGAEQGRREGGGEGRCASGGVSGGQQRRAFSSVLLGLDHAQLAVPLPVQLPHLHQQLRTRCHLLLLQELAELLGVDTDLVAEYGQRPVRQAGRQTGKQVDSKYVTIEECQ